MKRRWSERADEGVSSRAFREAEALGHSWYGVDHVLLALLDPPALWALRQRHCSHDEARRRLGKSLDRVLRERFGCMRETCGESAGVRTARRVRNTRKVRETPTAAPSPITTGMRRGERSAGLWGHRTQCRVSVRRNNAERAGR